MIWRHFQPRADVLRRAALLGVVAGLRSQLPFALLALAARRGKFAADARLPLGLLRSRGVLAVCGLAALGEQIGDKLPIVPSRLALAPFGGRLLIGSLAGAAICGDAGQPAVAGALLGLAGAGAGAVAGYGARTLLGRATGIADPLLGVAEDCVAVALGLKAIAGIAGIEERRAAATPAR
ncbi:MAG TPA: DUF4126 family protein [Roseiflexaceae bacterium]